MDNVSGRYRRNSRFLSQSEEIALIELYGKFCWYCGKRLLTRLDVQQITPTINGWRRIPDDADCLIFDHVIPRSRGGSNNAENAVPCCNACNATKRDKDREEFREYLQRKTGSSVVFWYEASQSSRRGSYS